MGKLWFLCLFLCFLGKKALARESFEFSLGNRVQILSDKAFRSSRDDSLEAVGNVIIIYEDGAIYGRKAAVSFGSGEVRVIGNVRYVGSEQTLHGSELFYNFHTKEFRLKNARIVSGNHTILGKELIKTESGVIVGEDAEYTTCKDCPESWAIVGRRVRVTPGEYVRIWHAYLKFKGVVGLYIPYIVFPIKKRRQTGLLFPKFAFNLEEGFHYQQPWFWALGDHADVTLAPGVQGERGLIHEFQLRKTWGEQKWFSLGSLQARDSFYVPNVESKESSGRKTFRHISFYEHHYTDGRYFNHHAYYGKQGDLDGITDFPLFSKDKVFGSESGADAFWELRQDLFALTMEGHFNRNLLYPRSREFDHRYVQILPELKASIPPVSLLQGKWWGGPNDIFLGFDGDFTHFRQDRVEEDRFIRNAFRYNLTPYLNWTVASFGPLRVDSKVALDYQHYRFPREPRRRTFTKRGAVFETEASLGIEKIFGVAFKEKVPFERVEVEYKPTPREQSSLIGTLPSVRPMNAGGDHFVSENSYKHKQEVKLKHYFLRDQSVKGSKIWGEQIQFEEGQFDSIDALREKEHTINTLSARTSLPLSNTIELQWNNSIIRKSARSENIGRDGKTLGEDFFYGKMAWLNVGQGYDLNIKSDKVREKLTRLHVTSGINWRTGRAQFEEYYFYNLRKSIASFQGEQRFGLGKFSLGFTHNPFSSPNKEQMVFGGALNISDSLLLEASYDYDLERKRSDKKLYRALFTPGNKCWKLELAYNRTVIDERVSLNVLINFNENSFKSFSDL